MFDLRYHVASLAAVFLALVIGILVGVGISGSVSKGEKSLEKTRISVLENQLREASKSAAARAKAERGPEAWVQQTYRAVMHNRLRGKQVAIVFVGPVDGRVQSLVQQTLEDAGAQRALRSRALKVPIDAAKLDGALTGHPALVRYVGDGQLTALGRALGEEFVAGGDTPLWDVLSGQLVDERTGGTANPAEGVVVVRSAEPQVGVTAQFLQGLYSGLASGDAPAVGVEVTDSQRSSVTVFRGAGLSSVDDLDKPWGRLALALLLAGGERGQYGLKKTADDVLPPVERVAPALG